MSDNGPTLSHFGSRIGIEHTPIYSLAESVRVLKAQRDALPPGSDPLSFNLSALVLTCAFAEAALTRGLVHAARHILFQAPEQQPPKERLKSIERSKSELQEGKAYGTPVPDKRGRSRYGPFIETILGISVSDSQVMPGDLVECIRVLFQLRNMIIHGQTFTASGVFSRNPADPISHYESSDNPKHKEIEAYLTRFNLWDARAVAGNLSFPYATNAIVDHLQRGAITYLRRLRDAVADPQLRYEFSAGCPQYLFPYLAGEATLI